MENQTGRNLDRDATRHHLDAARVALQFLDEMAAPDGVTLSGRIVARHLGVAMNELIGVDVQISRESPAVSSDSLRVACSSCGNMIMQAATLCGYCWRRPGDPATAKSIPRK